MQTAEQLLREAQKLTEEERKRLVLHLLASMGFQEIAESLAWAPMKTAWGDRQTSRAALDAWLSLGGAGSSGHADISKNKYKHLADVYSR